jgi:hypothetical protein
MPAIQVARTDTFERQRVKINQISDQIFSISQGGSDLSTGILKLGNGTLAAPSLAFTNDSDTGFIRYDSKTIGVVSTEKLVASYNSAQNYFYNNTTFIKNSIATSFLSILDAGQNYDPGSYNNIPVIGGSGIGGSFNIVVESFSGSVTNYGEDYRGGAYSGILLEGGSGSGASLTFDVSGIEGSTTSAGSGYGDGLYSDIPFQGGSGSGARFGCNVNSGEVTGVNISNSGSGYRNGDVLTVNAADLGGSGGGFQFTISNNPGRINEDTLTFTDKGSGYQVGDVLTLPNGVTSVSTTLDDQSADITVTAGQAASLRTGFIVTQTSGTGVLSSGGGIGGGQVTVFAINGTTITLSSIPDTSGSAVLDFIPTYGIPTTSFAYTISSVGTVGTVTVSQGGSGYAKGDIVSVSPYDLIQPISYTVTVDSVDKIDFVSTVPSSFVSVGQSVYVPGGGIQTTSITSSTTIGAASGTTYSNLTGSTSGSGSGAVFSITRGFSGDIASANVTSAGVGYSASDTITILGADVGGSTPTDNVVITVNAVTQDGQSAEVYEVSVTGGNINYIVCDSVGLTDTNSIARFGTISPTYEIDTLETSNKYFIDSGSGAEYHPDLTLYSGNRYRFNNSSNTAHPFRFSAFKDGIHSPSYIQNISSTLSVSSAVITVADTTGILAGMIVSAPGGGGGGGALADQTKVLSVDSATQITLDKIPVNAGPVSLNFQGYAYTDGVSYEGSYSEILVSDTTPSPLYYYCTVHPNMGGYDNAEAQITVDTNNPKVFGSGFSVNLSDIQSVTAADINISDRKITTEDIEASTADIDNLTVNNNLTALSISGNIIALSTINSSSNFTLNASGQNVTVTANNFKVGTLFNVASSTGNLQTSGNLKTLATLNVNDKINITNNIISSTAGNDILIKPPTGRITKIDNSSALVIPVGDTNSRPGSGIVVDGSIRFNTDNSQYEGYSASTSSWSSLGGVRDVDGNTYILAELTAGANDNTLWFYNDNVNTLKLTGSELNFKAVKKISSERLGLPTFSNWVANTPVVQGAYIKYRNNLYEVTASGTTGGSGTEPTHTTGAANSGTAQLTWSQLAVSPLTFDGAEEIRIGPNKDCSLVIGQELRIFDNTISTSVKDLVIQPNAGKQVIVNSVTHFKIPAGTDNEKSIAPAGPGSIRFNTTIQQFEGYSGTNWSSLGGVRDVDGNTYIIPETAPAANENILYFYNNNVNTLQLSESSLDFTGIDNITTSGGNSLAINTETVTLNSLDTTIDNSAPSRTFIHTSKQYLDLGLSSGLNVDPVLRLDDQGDVYLNTTFGSGTFNGVKVLDGELKEFELADYKIKTATFSLIKGGAESSAVVLYPSSSSKGCKVTVVSKSTSGKRSMSEYSVIDNGTDIFHNEYGSLNTSADQYTASFDFNASTEARITLALSSDHSNGDIVNFTVLVQEIK